MRLLLRIAVIAAGLWVAAVLTDGIRLDPERSPLFLLAVAVIVGALNVTVRPLLTILSLPLVVLTLGLFLVVINAISLSIAFAVSASFDLGLTSDGFGSTMLAAIVVSIVSAVASRLLPA